MRKFLVLCLCAFAAFSARAAEQVVFDGKTYTLAFQSKKDSLREYLPKGEELKSWTRLVALREYRELHDPKQLALNLGKELKKQNPLAPSDIIENKSTGEVIIDFITWPPDSAFVEFNIFKYGKSSTGGVACEQFAMRKYGEAEDFLRALKGERRRLVEVMAQKGVQAAR